MNHRHGLVSASYSISAKAALSGNRSNTRRAPVLLHMLRHVPRPMRPAPAMIRLQQRWLARANSSRGKVPLALSKSGGGGGGSGGGGKSEWWAVDGEMHEVGEGVPHRERFVIPRDNLPNRRRKQMRDQFMRRTRLVLKDSEHEPWCRKYMELYNELRENWERLYWDEGYSKKLAQDHANYESAEDDDSDFSPYRRRPQSELNKDQGFLGNRRDDTWDKVRQIKDKFEYDREKRMREKAFAPMGSGFNSFNPRDSVSRNPPFHAKDFFRNSTRDG